MRTFWSKKSMDPTSRWSFINWLIENKKKILKWLIIYVVILGIIISQVKIVEILTPSIPYRFCLQVYHWPAKKGDLCVFKVGDKDFVKYMAGEEGDTVTIAGKLVFVNDDLLGEIKKKDGLTPAAPGVIPEGYVFMIGTHDESLDSRYKEIGLIKRNKIKGRAFGILRYKK